VFDGMEKSTALIRDQSFSCVITCVITGRLNMQFANHNAQSNLQDDSQISPAGCRLMCARRNLEISPVDCR
jgi:hypothetical protein